MRADYAGLETGHILSCAAGQWFCLSGTAALAADRLLDGLTVTYKPYIEGEGGYDSNPDNSTDQLGSAFEKVEGGLRVIAKNPREYYEFNLKARDIHFNELEREDRWDYRVALDTDFDIGGGQNFKFGIVLPARFRFRRIRSTSPRPTAITCSRATPSASSCSPNRMSSTI